MAERYQRPATSTGYTLLLPPGWLRLDARSLDGPSELDALLDEALTNVPRDSVGPLIEQTRTLAHDMLRQARTSGALDLYLPLAGVRGKPIPASFVVRPYTAPPPPSGMTRQDDTEAEALLLAAALAERLPDGQLIELPAGPAVRSARTGPSSPYADWPSREIDYQLPLPGESMEWVAVTFATFVIPEAPQLADSLVALFDAIMSTWRWDEGLVL